MTWQIEHEFQIGDHITHTLDPNISGYISGIDASDIVHIGNQSVLKEHIKLSTDPTEYGWHNTNEFERREKLKEIGIPDMYIDHPWRDIIVKKKLSSPDKNLIFGKQTIQGKVSSNGVANLLKKLADVWILIEKYMKTDYLRKNEFIKFVKVEWPRIKDQIKRISKIIFGSEKTPKEIPTWTRMDNIA